MPRRAVLEELAALTTVRSPLHDLPAASGIDPDAAWTPVRVGGITRIGRAIDASTTVEWQAYAMPGSRVVVWSAARSSVAGVTLTATCDGSSRRVSIAATPEQWTRLRLRLPPRFRGEVRLSLSIYGDTSGTTVWIGDPELSYRRGVTAIGRTAIGALGLLGARAAVQRAAAAAAERNEAERYRAWRAARREPPPRPRSDGPLVSIVTPVFNTDPVWLRACIESVRRQSYQRWELILSDDGSTDAGSLAVLDGIADPRVRVVRSRINRGIASASNAALALAAGQFVALLDHDDELTPGALSEIVERFEARPSADVVYSDEDIIDPSGVHGLPHFKPDWSPELLTSCMYVSHLVAFRRSLIDALGGFREGYDGAQDYDLLLRASERTAAIEHVPRVLYSWRATPESAAASRLAKPWAVEAGRRALADAVARRQLRGTIERTAAAGHFRVRYRLDGSARVSAILVGPSGPEAAAPLLPALARHPRVGEALDARGENIGGGERIAALARAAREAFVLLIDPRLAPLAVGWLEALMELAQLDPIGAAGAVLLAEDGTIDHAGIVLGAGPLAACALNGAPGSTRGHRANALDVRNCSAVSARCLLTRRRAMDAAGGFDAMLDPPLVEIDYGLRLEATGLRVAVTPHARLRGPSECGYERLAAAQTAHLRGHWGDRLETDPYYNPNFDRETAAFTLPATERVPISRAT
jgi:GT2 family glycosyltransferase